MSCVADVLKNLIDMFGAIPSYHNKFLEKATYHIKASSCPPILVMRDTSSFLLLVIHFPTYHGGFTARRPLCAS